MNEYENRDPSPSNRTTPLLMKPALCAFLFLTCASHAQQTHIQTEEELQHKKLQANPSANFSSSVGSSEPVVNLPDRVPAPEGKVTLWADFDHADEKGVPLYLVNQTNLPCSFDTQDNDLYIKLHFKDDDDKWQLAQGHISSWCGNSYIGVSLSPRHYFSFRGYKPASGKKRIVRYENDSVCSNEGSGFVSEDDLHILKLSDKLADKLPFCLSRFVETSNEATLADNFSLNDRADAVRLLEWYPRTEKIAASIAGLRLKATDLPASKARDALLSAISHYFSTPASQGEKYSKEELLTACLLRISNEADADGAISDSDAWGLLSCLLYEGILDLPDVSARGPAPWKKTIPGALAIIKEADGQGIRARAATMVLSTGWIVDSFVKNEEAEAWLVSPSKSLRELGAQTLARRSLFDKMVEIAWKRPGPEQIMILKYLAYPVHNLTGQQDGARQVNYEGNEVNFWEHCINTMPLETAKALWDYQGICKYISFNRLIHDPLHEYFKKESDRREEHQLASAELQSVGNALQMLASWHLEEDDEVFEAMLNHGAYVKHEFNHGSNFELTVEKDFRLRAIAREALIARGHPLKAEVVLKAPMANVKK